MGNALLELMNSRPVTNKLLRTSAPRYSDRIIPGEPLNVRGLLDAATMIPVVGDALSGGMAVYDAVKGDYPSAAMNALGVLPFIGGAGTIKYGKGFNSESVKDLISSQRYLDRDTVAKKIKANDFTVNVTPEFEIDGEKFRAITDGHHSLEAARISRNEPVFIIDNASTNDKVGLLGRPNDYLEAAYHDSPWYRWIDKKDVW